MIRHERRLRRADMKGSRVYVGTLVSLSVIGLVYQHCYHVISFDIPDGSVILRDLRSNNAIRYVEERARIPPPTSSRGAED